MESHSPDFQNSFEPSNASTNVVNAPREPYVVKQDNESFVDKIIFDLNRALDSLNQFYCFHCKDVLRDGEACKRYGIFCKRYTCKSCGKDAHIGYNCPSKVPIISNQEPCNNQTIDELPQTLPIFHPTFHSEAESPFTLDSTPTYVDESPNIFNPPPQSLVYPCEFYGNDAYYGHYYTPQAPFIYPEPYYNQDFNFLQDFQNVPQQYPCCDDCGVTHDAYQSKYWKLFVCYDDGDDEERSDSLDDNIISGLLSFSAITPDEPVLSTEEPDNSLNQIEDFFESNEEFSLIDDDSFSIDDITYVEASPSNYELVSSEVMDIVIPEETTTFDNSLPEFETFCFDVKEISIGSTTTPPDISLPKYEVFHDDHVKEFSSGSPTTHSDSSLYASFMFDLSINPFPSADRSDSYEFTDELIPFISPEYDCFLFKVEPNLRDFTKDVVENISPTKEPQVEPNSRDFTKDVVENISPTKEPQVLTTLPTHPTLELNMKFQLSSEYLFAYVVWIFPPFLVYSVVPHYLLSLRNEDIIFDP
nr:hypothetical protein [Tanacetum cinerariifolium]